MSHNRNASEIEHFRKIFEEHDTTWWGNVTVAGQLRAERRWGMMIDYIRPAPEHRVLELGCGDGIGTARLAKTGARIIAIDVSEDLIAGARDRLKTGNVEFKVGDAEELPFEDRYFDAVVGNSLLHHVRLKHVLKEIKRALRPGGKMAFCEPNMLNPQVFLERKVRFIGKLLQVSPHETAFFRWSLSRGLEDAGFKNIAIRPFDFLHPMTCGPLIKPVSRIGSLFERVICVREFAGSLSIQATT